METNKEEVQIGADGKVTPAAGNQNANINTKGGAHAFYDMAVVGKVYYIRYNMLLIFIILIVI